MPHCLVVVTSDVVPDGDEAAYNHWYNERHLPDVVAVDPFVSARRYRKAAIEIVPGLNAPSPARYVAVYEVEGETEQALAEAAAALRAALEGGAIDLSPLLDMTTLEVTMLVPVAEYSR